MSKTALTMLANTSTLGLGGMVRANVATITETYDFTATFPAGAAFSTWDGSFTITFDPTLSGAVGPLALDAFSSNLPASYNPFVYSQIGVGTNFVNVGDNCSFGGCEVVPGQDQAALGFPVSASGVPFPIRTDAGIASTSNNEIFDSTGASVTLAPTPLPAALRCLPPASAHSVCSAGAGSGKHAQRWPDNLSATIVSSWRDVLVAGEPIDQGTTASANWNTAI